MWFLRDSSTISNCRTSFSNNTANKLHRRETLYEQSTRDQDLKMNTQVLHVYLQNKNTDYTHISYTPLDAFRCNLAEHINDRPACTPQAPANWTTKDARILSSETRKSSQKSGESTAHLFDWTNMDAVAVSPSQSFFQQSFKMFFDSCC